MRNVEIEIRGWEGSGLLGAVPRVWDKSPKGWEISPIMWE